MRLLKGIDCIGKNHSFQVSFPMSTQTHLGGKNDNFPILNSHHNCKGKGQVDFVSSLYSRLPHGAVRSVIDRFSTLTHSLFCSHM